MSKCPSNYYLQLIILLLAMVPAAYFYGPNFSNQTARLAAIYSLVERDVSLPIFSIDRYLYRQDGQLNIVDWSLYQGHYYANKAPGTILLGAIPYSLAYSVETLIGASPDQPMVSYFNFYLINFFVSVLPFALSAVALLSIMQSFSLSLAQSIAITLLYIFASPLIPYNHTLWGGNSASSFLVLALYCIQKGHYRPILAGIFLGLAVLCDYLASIAALGIFVLALVNHRKLAIRIVIGGMPFVLIIALYHYLCFGSFFKTSISDTNQTFLDPNLFLGVFALPSSTILLKLLFSIQRGAVIFMPILMLAFVGCAIWLKRNCRDLFLWLCLFNIFGYLLIVSAFNGWHGGATTFPRYLLPSLVFWIIPIKECWGKLRLPVITLAIISCSNMFILAVISPFSPDNHPNPLYGFAYQLFFAGELSPIKMPIRLQGLDPQFESYQQFSSGNLGQLMGLEGYLSILPLILMIVGLLILLRRTTIQVA